VVLVDASIWVLVGVRPEALKDYVAEDQIVTCPPVVQEILQGARNWNHFETLRAVFARIVMLDAPMPLRRYEEGARLFIQCRDAGFTIRKSVDCLIAACALAHNVQLLHNDRDFKYVAKVFPLDVISL
jgi:predicted nucleic acid-binding protein